jgi:WD40 repeat protein
MVDVSTFPGIGLGYRGTDLHTIENELITACGNGLSIWDVQRRTTSMLRGEGLSVGALAVNARANIVAYAERTTTRGAPSIFILRWQSKMLHSQLTGSEDQLGYTHLDFSADGTILVSLGDVPDFSVVLWDWERSEMLVSSVCSIPCDTIMFHPANQELLISKGATGGLLWRFDKCVVVPPHLRWAQRIFSVRKAELFVAINTDTVFSLS